MYRPSDEIIEKVLNGLASEEQAVQVAKWFSTDEGQQYLSSSMHDYFFGLQENFEDFSTPHKIPSERIWKKIEKRITAVPKEKHNRRNKNYKIFLRIASIFILIFTITFFTVQLGTPFGSDELYAEIYVPKGETKQIVFQDGSTVHLNADSKFSYPKKFGLFSRNVKLEGEAYFNVEKNKRKPFIVELEHAEIKVTGTSFNVKAYAEDKNVRVCLDDGNIVFVADSKQYKLSPQQMIRYEKETHAVVTSSMERPVDSSWKNNIITFDNTPLEEIIHVLNRWYGVEFLVEDNSALDYSYTFTTRRVPLMFILSDFEKISPLRFSLENDTVKITMN